MCSHVFTTENRTGKCTVIKTSTRQTIFLPVVGLVDATKLAPGDLVGVNKDSYLILDTLPAEYDSRVKAMEVDEKPTEEYSDIGGLDKQIQEVIRPPDCNREAWPGFTRTDDTLLHVALLTFDGQFQGMCHIQHAKAV